MTQQKWTAADLPAMTSQTVVVTGASSGLGLVTARQLARAGARVVLAVRDEARGATAAATMPGRTEVRQLDLSSQASVRAFAAAWTGPLDILINNAGIMQVPQARTSDGFEVQIATNHLGPFALTTLLLPNITGRVVTVSSEMHKRGRIDPDHLNGGNRPYDAFQTYCDTKLANLLFTFELQRRLARTGSGVRAMAAHPGLSKTGLASHVTGLSGLGQKILVTLFAQDAEHGALPALYAATADLPGGTSARLTGTAGPG
jgi:NAD(P)-dependent dehydrogenase (short-subunit alcohol dehydrogenase family)